MPTIKIPNNWQPRDYQRPMWDYLEKGGKRAIGAWHRRAGKDDVLLHRTAVAAFERPATYWTALPEYAQARKALWTAVNPHTGKRRIDEAFPHELRDSTNEAEMFIRLKSGSTWQLVGSDRYDSLVGASVAGVTFSEAALANPSAWGYIRPMLEENNGWAAFISTPRGRNHFKSLLELGQKNPSWFAQVLTVNDTGALTQAQIDDGMAEYCALYGEDIGRAQFEQEYLCSFNAAILGAFYAREMTQVRGEGRIAEIEPLPGKPVHTAWDIGVKDDTSIWWFQVVGRQLLILDCYTASGVGVDHYAEVCHSKPWPRGKDYVPHDAKVKEWGTGKTRTEVMTSLGLKPELVPMATKMDGIQAVRSTLPRCIFHPRTEDKGISALEQYRREWDDEKKTFKPTEVHDWTSHLADAFRYLALSWRRVVESVGETLKQQPATTVAGIIPPPVIVPDGKRISF
jgi:phage terminase large subunit